MTLHDPSLVRTAALLGMGSVGSGWATLLLAKGIKLRAYDPGEKARVIAEKLISGAWPSLVKLKLTTQSEPPLDQITFCDAIEDAARDADVVIENAPEKLPLKQDLLKAVDRVTGPDVPVLSSAGGIAPSDLQRVCTHPQRVAVMHPFNPSHLIPLVEIVGGEDTAPETVDWARDFALLLGKKPVVVTGEMPGHMVNRLQFALVREAMSCLVDGIATAEDIDTAVRYGLAPRWLLQGGLQTVAMAGGPGGMGSILNHAGAAMEEWWTPRKHLTLTEDVRKKLAEAALDLSKGKEFEDWAAWRDAQLVEMFTFQAQADGT
ncbi:MAG: 3-hydroxyacyl-CoA dehydrogenase NAD-binding domain-containing protein, partial [Pseudomonadota bacterium]